MNRKILGNSFFMDLYLTGISRLWRAPEREVTQAGGYTEPQAEPTSIPSPPQHTHHKIQVCSSLGIIWLYCNQLTLWRASLWVLIYSGCRCSPMNPPANMDCWLWDTMRWEYPPCDCCCLKEQLFYKGVSPPVAVHRDACHHLTGWGKQSRFPNCSRCWSNPWSSQSLPPNPSEHY